jgi:acetylglutamate kinase
VDFSGKTFVVRVDDATARDANTTLIDDLRVLAQHQIHPIVVAPDPSAARTLVRALNRSANVAVALGGSDAALLPQGPTGIGHVQARILFTLTGAGFIPVVEPTAFALFGEDEAVLADDVAAAIGAATEATRAIFFHRAGGVADPATHELIEELTPAEALELAGDARVELQLRNAMRAAAIGVRSGIPAAQIVDGRVAHAALVEVLTTKHLGTQVAGGIIL